MATPGHEYASVGIPINGLEARIVGDDGTRVGTGFRGELQLRGLWYFTHYHNNESATRSAFTADGWFRTERRGLHRRHAALSGRSPEGHDHCQWCQTTFSHELGDRNRNSWTGLSVPSWAAFPTRKNRVRH